MLMGRSVIFDGVSVLDCVGVIVGNEVGDADGLTLGSDAHPED